MWRYGQPNELYHYGILGMKWGVRRYQTMSGKLTPEGKKRYSQEQLDAYRDKHVGKYNKASDKIYNKFTKQQEKLDKHTRRLASAKEYSDKLYKKRAEAEPYGRHSAHKKYDDKITRADKKVDKLSSKVDKDFNKSKKYATKGKKLIENMDKVWGTKINTVTNESTYRRAVYTSYIQSSNIMGLMVKAR